MNDTLESFLASLSDLEREELATLRRHACSFYTLDGRHVTHPWENEDLLAGLLQKECYIADTNSNWKAEATKPDNHEKAFIIGRTLSDEESNLKGIFFGPKVDTRNNNIYILGIDEIGAKPLIVIERLDPHYRLTFDESSLAMESQSRQKRTDAKFKEWKLKRTADVQHEKECILLLLGVKDISDLRPAKDLVEKVDQLMSFIRQEAPKCVGNWAYTVGVARACYALLLIENRSIRTEFSKKDYDNVFGDTLVLHNALFLQANILSNDNPLKRMTVYVGLECFNAVPQ